MLIWIIILINNNKYRKQTENQKPSKQKKINTPIKLTKNQQQ